jgi:hypothetical protein
MIAFCPDIGPDIATPITVLITRKESCKTIAHQALLPICLPGMNMAQAFPHLSSPRV